MSAPAVDGELWFLTGSQSLYGAEVLQQVAEQSRAVCAQLDDGLAECASLAWKPVLTEATGIRRMMLEANADPSCLGVIAWMHTFSPAKMWIGGLDVLDKPLLHLHTQANESLPWTTIDMDFMNLNQAAHGDREFGYIQTRLGINRRIVVGHASSAETVRAVAGGRARPWAERRSAPSVSPASATTCATSP